MEKVHYSDLSNNLSLYMDKVNADHRPIIITCHRGEEAVLMSLKDFQAYEETMYLMRSPKNMKRLDKSIQAIKVHKVLQKT